MFQAESIKQRIVEAGISEAGLEPDVASDVAFHMTDWQDNLATLVDFYRKPEALDPEKVNELLLAFLIHAPNHLAAAARLYADFPVSNVFGVDAVRVGGANE